MAIEGAYELAYREAVRALEHQRAEAAELQSRAGMLLATASIAVSLLGDEASAVPALAWLVVLCFALLSVCVLAVIWPHRERNFRVDPQALLAMHLANGAPDARTLSSDLIAYTGFHHRANGRRLAGMSVAFRIGACLLAIQLVLTLAAVTINV